MDFQLGYIITAIIAGVLTILSPCVLPLLPIVISGSLDSKKSFLKPLRIIGALAISVIIFSILLKASTALLGVPSWVWKWVSGIILVTFGIVTLFPNLWTVLIAKIGLKKSSDKLLSKSLKKGGAAGDILVGASLGPVFTSCSPTYLAIVGIILPQNWLIGSIYLLGFVLGLVVVLILIAVLGQRFVAKLNVLNNPKGWFKKILGLIFILVGVLIIAGYDKKIESYLVEKGLYDWLINLEDNLPSHEE